MNTIAQAKVMLRHPLVLADWIPGTKDELRLAQRPERRGAWGEGRQLVAAAVGATKLAARDAPSWWLHPMCCVRLRALLWYAIRRRRGSQRAFAPRWGPAAAAEGVLAGCCPHAVLGHADWRACHVGRYA